MTALIYFYYKIQGDTNMDAMWIIISDPCPLIVYIHCIFVSKSLAVETGLHNPFVNCTSELQSPVLSKMAVGLISRKEMKSKSQRFLLPFEQIRGPKCLNDSLGRAQLQVKWER